VKPPNFAFARKHRGTFSAISPYYAFVEKFILHLVSINPTFNAVFCELTYCNYGKLFIIPAIILSVLRRVLFAVRYENSWKYKK